MTQTVMQKITMAFGLVSLSMGMAGPAMAQSTEEFVAAFGGDWYVFEPAFQSGTAECRLTLAADMAASAQGCAATLASLAAWRIEEGQIILLGSADQRIASLGGNQRRVTGNLDVSGQGLIIERADGDGTSAAINAALARHKCYFLGFTRSCAGPDALAAPSPAAEGDEGGRIEVLVSLNVRIQPRRDAPIIGTLAEGTVVNLDYCTRASDGIWCRALFGTEAGWLAKTALRQNEWPIVTYRVSTSAP